jgi:ribosomal protein S16
LLVQNISSDLKQTLVSTASAQQNIDRDIMNEWSSSGAQFTSTAGDHTMAIVSSDGINHRDAVDKIEAQVL